MLERILFRPDQSSGLKNATGAVSKETKMAGKFCGFVFFAIVLSLPAPPCAAQEALTRVQKQQERNTVSLDLEFSKSGDALEGTLSVLFGINPNGYATGFLVGD